MLEWTLLVVVIGMLVVAFGRQVRTVQVQGERAAVQHMLGHLRTALVLNRLGTQLNKTPGQSHNPLLLLERTPANFAGDHAVAQAHRMVPGTWVWDGACGCVGYRLLYPEGLEVPTDAGAIWFRVEGLAGPLQIRALVPYVWQGQLVD